MASPKKLSESKGHKMLSSGKQLPKNEQVLHGIQTVFHNKTFWLITKNIKSDQPHHIVFGNDRLANKVKQVSNHTIAGEVQNKSTTGFCRVASALVIIANFWYFISNNNGR